MFIVLREGFWDICKTVFILFGGAPVVSACLILLGILPDNLAYGFGAGLYYGTIGIFAIISKLNWEMSTLDSVFLGVIITSLICYIVYLKEFKPEKQS